MTSSPAGSNPRVNRYLHDKAMDRVDHALGRPLWPLRETYRNYFATDVDSSLVAEFDRSPYWHLSGVQGRMAFFHVTAEGKAALDRHLQDSSDAKGWLVRFEGYTRIVPAASAAKAKYAYFLEISDSWSELRFGDFCRAASARRAA